MTLTQAPPSSDIFVLADASAKNTELKSAVEAMIESSKSKVSACRSSLFDLLLQFCNRCLDVYKMILLMH